MAWKGKFFGALIGFLITRNVWGAVMGAILGHMFDQNAGLGYAGSAYAAAAAQVGAGGAPGASISDVFFRTTFELMGHVAKSDGRVSEAEINAARRLMQELRLGPDEINAAIACFRFGKSTHYDANSTVENLRDACGMRHDLLRAFMELQLRAALAGNGMSLPARAILTRVAERLGMSGLEFAHMEAAQRARHHGRSGPSGRPSTDKPLAQCYAELEIDASISDQAVTKAYRRQMSRHHPDKLVANGLPESMAQVAKERTQRIQEAYETIRAARGMR
ncbi:MAG TPA: co-chaperone DjlA [Steroidobacteraceae bacterium]|nr:co-chaperone DjlA [Steroidobacteraceae bacterium]